MNFLHHVTDKAPTVEAWSRAASWLVFNENTPFWATGWTMPYVLARLGLTRASDRWARRIERRSIQHLERLEALRAAIGQAADIVDTVSFLSERSFFYCSVFSFFMRCYGPPTPRVLKTLFLGPLRPVVVPLTVSLARALIEFDAAQPRARDSFVSFVCRSRHWVAAASGEDGLACPECRGALDGGRRCARCDRTHPLRDGMLFLVPQALHHLHDGYRGDVALLIDAEHV